MTNPERVGVRAIVESLSVRALWPPALVFVVYVCACLLGVTTQLLWIDMVFHLFGGFTIACCVSRTLETLNARDMGRALAGVLRAGFILSMTATVALF